MSSENKDYLKMLVNMKRDILHFAGNYASAVKSGANTASQQIIEAVEELNQPADIPASKLISAVKSGVQNASEQMIHSGMDFLGKMNQRASSKKKNKK